MGILDERADGPVDASDLGMLECLIQTVVTFVWRAYGKKIETEEEKKLLSDVVFRHAEKIGILRFS